MKKVLAVLTAMSLSGCGGITVERFDGTSKTMNGVPYNLPMTAFTVTITRTITGCDGSFTGDVQVVITSKKAVDPNAMFTLHSNGWFDTSDLKVSFDTDGASSAVNTSVSSQVGTVLTNVVTAAAAIAPILAAGGGRAPACSQDIIDALKAIGHDKGEDGTPALPGLKDKVTQETAELAATSAQITLLSSQIATLGKDADRTLRQALSDDLKKQSDEQIALKADQDKLAELLKLITDVQTEQWPSEKSNYQLDPNAPFSVPDKVWEKWKKQISNLDVDQAKKEFDVYLNVTKLGRYGAVGTVNSPIDAIDVSRGVPVRFPVPARLTACRVAPCGQAASKEAGHLDGPVLQYGLVYAMPVTGGAFHSSTFQLNLDALGNPTLVDVAQTASIAGSATSTLNTVATQVAGIPAAMNTLETAKANLQTAKNNLVTAQANSATVSQLAPIQADVALKQAEQQQISANAALETAQKANGISP